MNGATVLVTGAAGFAGSHLLDLLHSEPRDVVAWSRTSVDLLDRQAVDRAIGELRPSEIYHCAGASHVARSWDHTYDTLATNVLATQHLLEAVRCWCPAARVVVPSSAYVYAPSDAPLAEDAPIGPREPYGFSKLAQEMLSLRAAADDGLSIAVARSFNHIGPRQNPSFFAPGIARRLARIEAGLEEPVVLVGNLEAKRDLTDVRDTVAAYRALMEHGQAGRIYNICSGRVHSMQQVLDLLIGLARVPIEVKPDASRYRPEDRAVLAGTCDRITEELGWQPRIPLERTLADLLEYWRDACES